MASAKRVAAAAERIEKHRAPQHMLLGINDAWQLSVWDIYFEVCSKIICVIIHIILLLLIHIIL